MYRISNEEFSMYVKDAALNWDKTLILDVFPEGHASDIKKEELQAILEDNSYITKSKKIARALLDYYLKGMTINQIAKKRQLPIDTINFEINQYRKILKEWLKNLDATRKHLAENKKRKENAEEWIIFRNELSSLGIGLSISLRLYSDGIKSIEEITSLQQVNFMEKERLLRFIVNLKRHNRNMSLCKQYEETLSDWEKKVYKGRLAKKQRKV